MTKQRVGVIFGGKSSEHEVSLQSAKNIIEALDRTKFDIVLIGIDKRGKWYLFDERKYLSFPDDPKRICLGEPTAPITLSLGGVYSELLHAKTGEILARLDAAFPIIHGT